MAAAGVLMRCLPGADPALLAPLVHAEGDAGSGGDWLARLAALGGEDPDEALRLSRAEVRDLEMMRALLASPVPVAAAAHLHGARAARAMALLQAAMGGTHHLEGLDAEIARGLAAVFPLSAADLMQAGLKPGPALGQALEAARARWIDSGFALDKAALMAQIGEIGHNH
jgi:poly(A) polymerase